MAGQRGCISHSTLYRGQEALRCWTSLPGSPKSHLRGFHHALYTNWPVVPEWNLMLDEIVPCQKRGRQRRLSHYHKTQPPCRAGVCTQATSDCSKLNEATCRRTSIYEKLLHHCYSKMVNFTNWNSLAPRKSAISRILFFILLLQPTILFCLFEGFFFCLNILPLRYRLVREILTWFRSFKKFNLRGFLCELFHWLWINIINNNNKKKVLLQCNCKQADL